LGITIAFPSCDDIIEYSPYKAGVKVPDSDLNIKAIAEIGKRGSDGFEPFSIGLFSDTHSYYDQFKRQVKRFNADSSIDFVVHLGDITVSGIYREFLWYRDIASGLRHPLITLIGNHDYLSNGEFMYGEMFGPYNFTMVYNDCLFVFFDDIIWEKNISDPDFDWLEAVLSKGAGYRYRFVLSHIPPWSDEFTQGNEYYFNMLMEKYDVALSLHGHTHTYYYGKRYSTGPYYFTSSSSKKEELFFMDVKEDGIEIRKEAL
jgi:predicted phosphodiesterase